MVLLLIDIGNSRLKWAEKRDQTIEPGSAFLLEEHSFEHQLKRAWKSIAKPARVLVANVAGEQYLHRLIRWVYIRWQLDVEPVRSQVQAFGVTNAYSQAETLGVDRWLALIAARHHFSLPACIIDYGTAATVDVLDQQGNHLGGIIMPGLRLMQTTLVQSTHAIEHGIDNGFQVLASDTASAVHSGAIQALLGMTERLIHHARTVSDKEVTVIITGGDAETVAHWMTDTHQVCPGLVLQGLAVVANHE